MLVRHMRIVLFTFLLLWAPCAIDGEVAGISPSGKADGKQFNFKVTDVDVKNTPAWALDAPNPPLAPRRAQEIARKQLEEFVADRSKWYVHEVSLIDFGDHIHWLYVVQFTREYPPDLAVFGADFFEIPVLMSGAVLKPEIRSLPPDEIKHR
jgi:hypothetical protein